jgi:hypothetical protein
LNGTGVPLWAPPIDKAAVDQVGRSPIRCGYVVAPPSRHASGRPYQWIAESGLDAVPDLPRMSGWLVELATASSFQAPAREQERPHVGYPLEYATAAMNREADEVSRAPRGQRNHRLNRAAFSQGQLVGAGLLDETTAASTLVVAGLKAGPGARKIPATVHRGLNAGMNQPHRIELR